MRGDKERVGRVHRLRHRRAAADRGDEGGVYRAAGCARSRRSSCPASIINMVAGLVSIRYGYGGPNLAHRQRVLDGEPQHRRRRAADRVRRRRRDDRRRHRGDGEPARRRRLLRGQGAFHAQRRSGHRQPAVGCRSRRLRAGRGRRSGGARRVRAREGARRADLLRARRIRDERGCAPHHRAAGRRHAARRAA